MKGLAMADRYIFRGTAKHIAGYASPLSARAGEVVDFKVCSEHPYRASLVRLRTAPRGAGDNGFEEKVEWVDEGPRPAQVQSTAFGSYLTLPMPADSLRGIMRLSMLVMPTLPDRIEREFECILDWRHPSSEGLSVGIDAERRFVMRAGHPDSHEVRSIDQFRVLPNHWYRLDIVADGPRRRIDLHTSGLSHWLSHSGGVGTEAPCLVAGLANEPMLIARQGGESGPSHFNGKVDRLSLDLADGTSVNWDFAQACHSTNVIDVSSRKMHGQVHGLPTRSSSGASWDGESTDLRGSSSRTAIHFHEDDLEDAAWTTSFQYRVPDGTASGAYAMKLASEDDIDYVPFMVVPPLIRRRKLSTDRVAVVLPTYTYTAYANMHSDVMDNTMNRVLGGRLPEIGPEEEFIQRRYRDLLGLSLYDAHVDGTCTVYSTHRRPLLHMRPHYRLWKTGLSRGFSSDLVLLGWLDRQGIPYDILTDEQVDFDAQNPLLNYRAVLTGDHPEYVTRAMRDRFEALVKDGGRLAYLGGNGFWWVTSSSPERPYFIEVRRGHGASFGAPVSLPGEEVHSLTGEQGGTWGFRGLTAASLLGVGTTACGWVSAAGYKRTPASRVGIGKQIFAGLDDVDLIGAGAGFPGIAGDEIDRADSAWGTPASTTVLATSAGLHDDQYFGLTEDYHPYKDAVDRERTSKIRADMTITVNPRHGAVFSVGSVAWMHGLRGDVADTSASTVLRNVLDLFLREERLAEL